MPEPKVVADAMRKVAADLQRQADKLIDAAEEVESDAGLYPPCHLCGARECGH